MILKIYTGLHKFFGKEMIGIRNDETKMLEDCFGVGMAIDQETGKREPVLVPLRPPIYLHDKFDNRERFSFALEDMLFLKELELMNEQVAAKLLAQYWTVHNIETKKQAKDIMAQSLVDGGATKTGGA